MLPRFLRVIGERTFTGYHNLKSVRFEEESVLEEIKCRAFYGCGLESFNAPPSLKKIGDMAFGKCTQLKDFRLNEGIQELGYLCFLGTQITNLEIPQQVGKTPQQLGIG